MRLPRIATFLLVVGLVSCNDNQEEDASNAFMEAAQALFSDKDTAAGIKNVASSFMQSEAGKQVGNMIAGGKTNGDDVGQIISGIGNLISASTGGQGMDLSMLGSIVQTFATNSESKRDTSGNQGGGMDFDAMINMASMFMGQSGNAEGLMGLLPMLLDNFGNSARGNDVNSLKNQGAHDHSSHSWYMPPILEHLHVMWDHFSNSQLGQTLWKNSGLANIVGMMSDERGNIQYEKILDSFENPAFRRRWIRSLTNFIAEWISHVSDPATQQRYLTTAQFVGNSFLKSQGFPKSVMFDPVKPVDSLTRLANVVAKRHLNMKIDSSQYIKPAVAYFQELVALASEKGFIMSRVNARELSNKLSEALNNEIVSPILKVYRSYKWATKSPKCAAQILCTINEKNEETGGKDWSVSKALTKAASFPAAWAISNKSGLNFWSLYGAVMEHHGCLDKFPEDCTAFHEEEIRVTTEYAHSEL